jgi:iron complex outermembrane receptor protein
VLLFSAGTLLSGADVEFSNTQTLRDNPLVLVNRQGLAQLDLSVRGSSYTGTGISINGLNLKVPYSAHYNAELPIPEHLLSSPQAQTGLDNVSGHLVGTAAYQTVPQEQNGQASAGIGTKEHYSADVSAFTSGIGGFLDWEKARHIDYAANDLDRYAGGAHLQHVANDWQFDLIGAHQQKEYGAQGYYGIPTTVYAEEQTEDSLIFFGATHGETDDTFLRASAAWRQLDNEYRIPVDGFSSDLRSQLGTAAIEGHTMEIQNIALTLRGDVEHERADGSIGEHDRTRASVLLLPQLNYERFRLKAGLNAVFQTSESAEWLPQAGADWFVTDNSTLYASYSENVQQPDFQMLFYSNPYHTNNPLLRLQKSRNVELGFRQFVSASLDWRATAFYRKQEDAADWIPGGPANTATDLGTLHVAGVESHVSFYPSETLELNLFYQWLEKHSDMPPGLYELDYPEHLLNITGHWKFSRDFMLFAKQSLRYQADNPARTSSDFGADASLGLHWLPRFANNVRLSFLADNVWGTNFQPIPGLKPRPTTVSTGITVAW